jgi:PAS domain S-box-containing protein
MDRTLTRDHVLAVLYDMAMVVGGEVRVRPLVTHAVQRLLYHTSFPVGLLLLWTGARDARREGRLEVAIGDYGLASRVGETLTLPSDLVDGPPAQIDDPTLIAALPVRPRLRGVCVRLPVGDEGVILLVAPKLPDADVPVTQVFQPVMANLARAIVLCRSHEAHTAALVAERDEARLGLARFRAAMDTAADLVFLIDPATQRFVDVNGTAEAVLGVPRAALIDHGLSDHAPELGPARLDALYANVRAARAPTTLEATLRVRDGATIPVEIRFSAVETPGEPAMIVAAARDVTERRAMEAQLRQAQKLDAIGRLAGGVAHDFNNLLTAILASTGVLLDERPAEDPAFEDLREIELAGQRAAALTRQLLIFSRKNPVAPTRVDLQACVDGMARMLKRLIGEPIELLTPPAEAPSFAVVDAGQLEQVILNLAVNARDAMPGGGRLTIEVLEGTVEPERGSDSPEAPPGRYAIVAVTDTGTGMPESVRAHLFEPFFTTKEPGRGTGLGLSTVYGIVRQANGHLRVTSAPGAGSRFEVWLPRAQPPDDEQGEDEAPPASRRGCEIVLLVEDERAVRELSARALRRAGYLVIEATDGEEALARAAQEGTRIDLLLTDAVMPRMGGAELAERLRAQRPGLRVLFVSGYPRDQLDEEALADAGFLAKPYRSEVLLRAIREQLDGRG